ncbi:MAG: hypothetical protein QOH33_2384 [Paraburkholderia sp.]|nr:hypothetical protein [Paraburkholderia sp.]
MIVTLAMTDGHLPVPEGTPIKEIRASLSTGDLCRMRSRVDGVLDVGSASPGSAKNCIRITVYERFNLAFADEVAITVGKLFP